MPALDLVSLGRTSYPQAKEVFPGKGVDCLAGAGFGSSAQAASSRRNPDFEEPSLATGERGERMSRPDAGWLMVRPRGLRASWIPRVHGCSRIMLHSIMVIVVMQMLTRIMVIMSRIIL